MGLDFIEIANSWFNKLNHSETQKTLADKRLEVCLGCEYKREILKDKEWSLMCGKCGCPLKAKVYTPKTYQSKDGSCPLDKWREVEDKYLLNLKKNKSLL